MKILITGGLGFIGTNLEKELIKRGHEVTILDRVRTTKDNYIRGDICDYINMKDAFDKAQPDCVVHLAAMVSRKESEETPFMAVMTNVVGTLNVASLCLEHKARLIYSGSSEEYGTAFDTNYEVSEDTPFGHPTSMYSMTKRMSEEVVQYYSSKGLVATTIRFFMLYGPGEPATSYRSALIRFVDAAMKGEDLQVHKDTVRQWCYIDDAVDAVVKVIERVQKQPYEDFNIGSSATITTEAIAAKIIRLANSKSQIRFVEKDSTIIPEKRARFTWIAATLGWKATTGLDDGITKVIQEYK